MKNINILCIMAYNIFGNECLCKPEDMTQSQSNVDREKYLLANPLTPLDKISESATVIKGKKIGEGGLGVVHLGEIENIDGNAQAVVIKTAKKGGENALEAEAMAGKNITNAYGAINSNTLLSNIQGLTMVAVPIGQDDGTLIQEAINGTDGGDAIRGKSRQLPDGTTSTIPPIAPFANGYVDDPQKAIERISGLALGLHGIHETGNVHHDLKLGNIMFEKQGKNQFGIRIIDLGASSQAGQKQTIASPNMPPEHFAAGERKNEIFKEVRQKKGTKEELSQADIRILQNEINEGYAATNRTSYDIYSMGTMLPALLFGQAGNKLSQQFEASQNPVSGVMEQNSPFIARCQQEEIDAKIALMEDDDAKNQIRELSNKLKELDGKFRSQSKNLFQFRWRHTQVERKIATMTAQLDKLEKSEVRSRRDLSKEIETSKESLKNFSKKIQLIEDSVTEIHSIKKQIEELLSENFPADQADRARDNAHKAIQQFILNEFQAMNDKMLQDTKKSYPQPVLERLAEMTADCLSMDPDKRPTADQVLLGLQNMGLSDWSTNPDEQGNPTKIPTYNYMPQPESDTDEAKIQGQFKWINPPPPEKQNHK